MESNVGMAEGPDYHETAGEICGYITSSDIKSWSSVSRVADGVSPYGIQMAVFRGELYGIMTGENKKLYANKYKSGKGWKGFIALPEKYKAAGRVSVATLQDRFYVSYRGTNGRIYLLWTYDFKQWNDLKELSPGGVTLAAPAIAGYDGKLYAACVGLDKNIWWAQRQGRTHAIIQNWTKVNPSVQSYSALSMVVHHSVLYLFHTGLDNKAIYGQTIVPGTSKFSAAKKIPANITSGPSAVSFKNDRIYITYRGINSAVVWVSVDSHIKNPKYATVPGKAMMYQTGLGSYLGYLFISFGVPKNSKSTEEGGNEKMALEDVEYSDDEWPCKWNEEPMQGKKSWYKKLLCM